jgi:hypothetical protein
MSSAVLRGSALTEFAFPGITGDVKSRDLQNWREISDPVSCPAGARPGTVWRVSEQVVTNLQNQTKYP